MSATLFRSKIMLSILSIWNILHSRRMVGIMNCDCPLVNPFFMCRHYNIHLIDGTIFFWFDMAFEHDIIMNISLRFCKCISYIVVSNCLNVIFGMVVLYSFVGTLVFILWWNLSIFVWFIYFIWECSFYNDVSNRPI